MPIRPLEVNELIVSGQLIRFADYVTQANLSGVGVIDINNATISGFSLNLSGKQLSPSGFYPLSVQHAKLPTGNSARIDAGESNWRVLFASGLSQSASWQFIMPFEYSTSLQARLHFTTNLTQGGTKNINWNIYSLNSAPNLDSADVNIKNFNVNSGTHTLSNNQVAGQVREQVIVLTGYTGSANHFSMLKLERGLSDTASGDAELIGVILEYK
jgi:hypothetical protein